MKIQKLALTAAAVFALVAAVGVTANAFTFSQRVLVYCPPSDTNGCATIVEALGNADRAYDGTNGTIDLGTADLSSYAVLIVPSLADDDVLTPYSLLRDSAVAAHLRKSVLGRRAFWSGTPDQGTANREAKNALLSRLADWAGGNHTAVGAPGLLVLQDASTGGHYGWVAGITGIQVVADPVIRTYSAVRAVTTIGTSIIGDAAYTNIASRGFFLPQGAAGISLDAVGQTGTTVGGQIVLMTHPGATEHQAVVATDKDDYEPGEPVIMIGSGYVAGESVSLTLAEDPAVHQQRSFTATADENGSFEFSGFAPEDHDLYVRFILTATGATSGRIAQTTFTDAISRTATDYYGVAHATNDTIRVPSPLIAAVAGDVLIAQITIAETTTGIVCAAAGWVFERSDIAASKVRQDIFYRVVPAGGEAGNTLHPFVFRTAGPCPSGGSLSVRSATGHITRYSGVDNVDPVDSAGGSSSTSSSSTFTAPSIGTKSTGSRVLRFVGVFKNSGSLSSVAAPVLLYSNGSSSNKERHAGGWDSTQTAIANTGTFAATGSSAEWVAQTIALRPAAAAKAAGSVSINNIPGVGVAIIGGNFIPAYTKLGDGTASTTSLTTGVCTVSGGTVNFIATGQCDLQASVTEGTAHLAATGATQSFNIGKAAGSVSINNIPGVGVAIIGGSFDPAYTKLGDGTASTTSLTTGICTVSGGTVSFIAAGQCDLQASVTEGTAHLAATGATQSFNIGKAAGSVSINNIPGVGVAIIGGSFDPAYTKLGDGTASTTSLTTGICTVSGGTVSFIAAGQCDLQASVTEGTAHLAATGATQSFNIGKAAGSVSINNIPGVGVAIIGGSFNPAYTKLGDGTASTTSLTTGVCTVSGGTVSFIAAGQCDLQASVTEGTAHLPATGTTQSFNIGKAAGSVSINNIPGVGVAIIGGSFNPAYTKLGDGTASTTSLTTGICTVSGGTVSFIAAGQCDLQASVTEGTAHLAATGATQSFNIGKAAGSVSINNIPGVGVAIIGGSFDPAYTKLGDGTASTTSLTTGICTVSGGTVNFIAAGQCDLQASVAEGTAHLAATGATQSFNIGKAPGSVSINNIPGVGVAIVGGSFDPAYTKLGAGTASTVSLTTGVCTVSGGTVSFIAGGECRLQASVTESATHLAATGAEQPFTVAKAPGSVSISNIPAAALVGGSFAPAYTKLGAGTASTVSLTTSICTVTAGTVNFMAAGQCDLQASVTESATHLAATGATQSFNIGAAATSMVLTVVPSSQQYSDSTVFTATVTPYEAGSQQLTGTVHFYVGAGIQACGGSAPAGAVGSDAVADADNGVGTLRYAIDKAAGAYKVTACFYSSSASFANSNDDENLTVRAEDATVYDVSYSPNPLQVPTPAGSFTFKIRETNPESNDPNLTAAGNISLAVADVILKGVLSPSQTYNLDCTPGAVSAGTGYAVYRPYSCILPAGMFADTYEAEIVVNNNGYYTDTTSTVVQVTDPNAGFATGGGWYTMENGDRVNFGFMAKSTVNNRKTVYQGSLLVIRHTATGQVFKAKSNVFDGYSIKIFTGGASASFSGKANYTVDGVSIGNFAFTGYAEDWGTPGVGVDEFGLYLASAGNQVATSTTLANLVNSARKLEGGNTQVPQPSKK